MGHLLAENNGFKTQAVLKVSLLSLRINIFEFCDAPILKGGYEFGPIAEWWLRHLLFELKVRS